VEEVFETVDVPDVLYQLGVTTAAQVAVEGGLNLLMV